MSVSFVYPLFAMKIKNVFGTSFINFTPFEKRKSIASMIIIEKITQILSQHPGWGCIQLMVSGVHDNVI